MNKRIRKKQEWRKGRRIISAGIEDLRKLDPHTPVHKVYFRINKKLIKGEIAMKFIDSWSKQFKKYLDSPEGRRKISESMEQYCASLKEGVESASKFIKDATDNLLKAMSGIDFGKILPPVIFKEGEPGSGTFTIIDSANPNVHV